MRLGSARALACCFRRPCRNEHRLRRRIAKVKKSAMTKASSPAREARAPRRCMRRDLAENSCARRVTVRNSQRHEDVRAFQRSSERVYCDLRFRGIPLGACAECFAAIASARPQRCESCRAHLRGDDDRLGQLRSCQSSAVGQRRCSGSSIFKNSGVDPVLGSIAVSWRMLFRACAARALLSTQPSRVLAER